MKIIIGLGNPGAQYDGTRHNIGFAFLDKLQARWNFPEFTLSKKFSAQVSQGKFSNQSIILVKPQTFMNLSGEAIISVLNFYHLSPEDVIVIHDELALILGKYKIACDSSSAGHNGVQNIIERLGTKQFFRIRIGIQPEGEIRDTTNFVLGRFESIELKKIQEIEESIILEIEKMAK